MSELRYHCESFIILAAWAGFCLILAYFGSPNGN